MKTVILCGGSGTRLWPVSRKKSPKQFAKIFEKESLFQKTVKRNESLSNEFIIVVNKDQLPLAQKQIGNKDALFLAEGIGRNTAPAIAMAALSAHPEDVLLVLPSDHLIKDLDVYSECVRKAESFANDGHLVTFGIKAAYPETGYGYIEAQGNDVKSFKEKPDEATAKSYVENGNYFWNSGMFCFKAGVFLHELEKHSPEMFATSKRAFDSFAKEDDLIGLDTEAMKAIPADSIDYAVMEKSDNVKVIPSPFYWSDLGSFDSLYDELNKDSSGNTKEENTYHHNSKNNLVVGGKRVIATFDVDDLIIVDTEDAILIGKRGQSQAVKALMQKVTADRPELAD